MFLSQWHNNKNKQQQKQTTSEWPYLKKSSSDESTQALEDDVEESLEDSDLAAEDESEGHRWVDVAAGDVADGLSDGGDRHAESEGDADEVGIVTSHADRIRKFWFIS